MCRRSCRDRGEFLYDRYGAALAPARLAIEADLLMQHVVIVIHLMLVLALIGVGTAAALGRRRARHRV